MNALDQAFFKAYGYCEAPAPAPESAVACAEEPVEATCRPPASQQGDLAEDPGPFEGATPAEDAYREAATEDRSFGPEKACVKSVEAGLAASPAAAPAEQAPFRPLLQVDRFAWPVGVTRLCRAAADPLESLIDEMAAGAAQGKNVIALGNCRAGDGATTLLLCLAKRLADHGVRVAIVDADFENPRMARRLGILADAGWDDVLARQMPLGEAVVESIHDRLVLLPMVERPDGQRASAAGPCDPAAMTEVLRRHYDVVLVDLGSCLKAGAILSPAGSAAPWVDRVVVVRNRRRTSSSDLAVAYRQARSSGAEVGVVENFA